MCPYDGSDFTQNIAVKVVVNSTDSVIFDL